MSTPVPQIFKVFSLHRYFAWCAEMREHYIHVGMQVSPTPSFFDNPDAGRAFMYLSYWYAGLSPALSSPQPCHYVEDV